MVFTASLRREKKKEIPAEFNGPAQMLMFERYGDPRVPGWAKQWLSVWHVRKSFSWFPENSVFIHKHFRPLLHNSFREIEYLGLHKEIKSCDTDFMIRFVTGSDSILSLHSWGGAIDMNAEENPLGSVGGWSKGFIDVMKKQDIFCGQNWIGRKDPMHFAMLNG